MCDMHCICFLKEAITGHQSLGQRPCRSQTDLTTANIKLCNRLAIEYVLGSDDVQLISAVLHKPAVC